MAKKDNGAAEPPSLFDNLDMFAAGESGAAKGARKVETPPATLMPTFLPVS